MPIRAPSLNEMRYLQAAEAERRAALREKIESSARVLGERDAIAKTLAVNEALAERIRKLGFDGDSARVLDLMPLVFISWADGRVQPEERATILGVLEARKVAPESEAATLIATLLERPPPQAFQDEVIRVLRSLAGTSVDVGNIVALCRKVAEASGGLLGIGKISGDESYLIEQIAGKLGLDAQKRFADGMR